MKKLTLTAFAFAAAFSTQAFAQDTGASTATAPNTEASQVKANSNMNSNMNSTTSTMTNTSTKPVAKKPAAKHYHHHYGYPRFSYGDHPMGWDGTGVPRYIPAGDNPKWYNAKPGQYYTYKGHVKYAGKTSAHKVYHQKGQAKFRYYDVQCKCYKFSSWDRQTAWDNYNKNWNGVWVQGKDGKWYDGRKLEQQSWKKPEVQTQPTTMQPVYIPYAPSTYDPNTYRGN